MLNQKYWKCTMDIGREQHDLDSIRIAKVSLIVLTFWSVLVNLSLIAGNGQESTSYNPHQESETSIGGCLHCYGCVFEIFVTSNDGGIIIIVRIVANQSLASSRQVNKLYFQVSNKIGPTIVPATSRTKTVDHGGLRNILHQPAGNTIQLLHYQLSKHKSPWPILIGSH